MKAHASSITSVRWSGDRLFTVGGRDRALLQWRVVPLMEKKPLTALQKARASQFWKDARSKLALIAKTSHTTVGALPVDDEEDVVSTTSSSAARKTGARSALCHLCGAANPGHVVVCATSRPRRGAVARVHEAALRGARRRPRRPGRAAAGPACWRRLLPRPSDAIDAISNRREFCRPTGFRRLPELDAPTSSRSASSSSTRSCLRALRAAVPAGRAPEAPRLVHGVPAVCGR